jgi:hypothetical protein
VLGKLQMGGRLPGSCEPRSHTDLDGDGAVPHRERMTRVFVWISAGGKGIDSEADPEEAILDHLAISDRGASAISRAQPARCRTMT